MWGYPLWLFLGLWIVMTVAAVIDRRRLARITAIWAVVFVGLCAVFIADYTVLPRIDHRYRAACAAALAGCGRGGDDAGLSQAERARWRERAREWLRAEVTLWLEVLESGPHADRVLVAKKLAHLWADPDLAGLLDPESLDQLPPAERQECRALWGEIDTLIRRAQTIN